MKKYIYAAIKRKMTENHISQESLAEQLNMSPKSLAAKLNFRRSLFTEEIDMISIYLWGDTYGVYETARHIQEEENEKNCQ